MKIASFHVYRYALPLTHPVSVGGERLSQRDGLLVQLVGADGEDGRGDVAPLPGRSPEDLQQAGDELIGACESLVGQTLTSATALDAASEPLLGSAERLSSSVRMGLDWAHASACLQARQEARVGIVRVNALLTADGAALREQVIERVRQGFTCLKLKVGRAKLEEDIERVRHVRACAGPGISLRLDANRTWSLQDALKFAAAIHDCDIEYIEEPVRTMDDLQAFASESGMAVALDEIVEERPADEWLGLGHIGVVVLKPTLLGGLVVTRDLVHRARDAGIRPILSAAYESGIGISAIAHAAHAWGLGESAHGLDTYAALESDVLVKSLALRDWVLEVAACYPGNSSIDHSQLECIR